MGMFKRIIRRTSSKLLNKLGAQRNSNQLVLNHHHHQHPAAQLMTQSMMMANHQHLKSLRTSSRKSSTMNSSQQVKSSKSKSSKSAKRDSSAIPEALLLAAKNHLPPVQFHHVHGPNALLGKNKFVARRTQSFCQALVFSNRVILPNERVYIKVLEIAKGWSGTIRFGFTSVDPATLRYQMPKHACPDMTSAGHTWARALADEVVRRNSVIHFSYNSNGYIHYGINNQDCGIFYANVNTSQHLWFIVDIYGLTAAVELIDPRIHNNASSELDLSRLDDEEGISRGSTMFKSTSAMDQLYGISGSSSSRNKKKRARKSTTSAARQSAALIYEHWSPENMLMSAPQLASNFDHSVNLPQARSMLPNLNSIILPTAQQNIYSPMPHTNIMMNRPPLLNDSHDYYQILSESSHPSMRLPNNLSQMSTSSALNSSATSSNGNTHSENIQDLSHQLNSFQIGERSSGSGSDNNQSIEHHHREAARTKQSPSKFIKSTTKQEQPVAAARRSRQQNNNGSNTTTNYKQRTAAADVVGQKDQQQQQKVISHVGARINSSAAASSKVKSTATTNNSSSTTTTTTTTHLKPKARQSLKSQTKSNVLTTRDNNNNSPGSKDCPICFERPINCVLYQCGHMCTCYECGVKQWRTQSRTCPICRTVIKDVIKTYMS